MIVKPVFSWMALNLVRPNLFGLVILVNLSRNCLVYGQDHNAFYPLHDSKYYLSPDEHYDIRTFNKTWLRYIELLSSCGADVIDLDLKSESERLTLELTNSLLVIFGYQVYKPGGLAEKLKLVTNRYTPLFNFFLESRRDRQARGLSAFALRYQRMPKILLKTTPLTIEFVASSEGSINSISKSLDVLIEFDLGRWEAFVRRRD